MSRYQFPTLLISLSALVTMSTGITWMTTLNKEWTFECPKGRTIRSLMSSFESNDRVWNFTCDLTDPKLNITVCEWSGYINGYRSHFHAQCPGDSILTGMSTYFDRETEDRRYNFLCCYPGASATHACQYTPYLNAHGQPISYRLLRAWYIRGFNTEVVSSDRLFSLNICRLDTYVATCYY
ncbi:unnamed protein product [Lymnaea stagnalis]|uniref:Dermatopontin n=1 Tax=Lymnaea stagnalis TaxID=6523 RepID=A0AAV2I2Z2_LYMST